MACVGEYERAHKLLSNSLNLNPHCPWWFNLGFFLVYYQNRQYKEALDYANKIVPPDVFVNPLTKAAAKGQLGLLQEAHSDVETLTEKFPQIVDNLKMYLSTFLLDDALIDDIVEGAKMAGLSVA
jgi:tetratricopeptide (TPR) repeat protein